MLVEPLERARFVVLRKGSTKTLRDIKRGPKLFQWAASIPRFRGNSRCDTTLVSTEDDLAELVIDVRHIRKCFFGLSEIEHFALVRERHVGDLNVEPVMQLIEKYSNVPMGFADACLVRMTETLDDPFILTTDQDFRVYRRHSRQVVPCATPE